jgi:hypothetical protein
MMNRRNSLVIVCTMMLSAFCSRQSIAQSMPAHHWGIGAGYFASHCDGYGCFDPGCFDPGLYHWGLYDPGAFGLAPIVFPPTIVVRVPAAIARPPAAQVAVRDVPLPPGVVVPRIVDPAAEIRRRADVLKPSTPVGRGRADRLVSSGDTAFADQIYARATARYREAIARAPDYSEPHFRLAHAYVATRQYNLALTSSLLALELAGSSRRDGFSLAELYRGNKFSRRKHDAQLLDAALREPEDGGLQFLIGLTLHYGGNPLKARDHFREAARLSGPQQTYVRHFLPVVAVGEPDPQAAGPEVK